MNNVREKAKARVCGTMTSIERAINEQCIFGMKIWSLKTSVDTIAAQHFEGKSRIMRKVT
jgi:hypothetical protein